MKRYAVKEAFNTLQGEGSRAGTRAVFVRFAGCNLWNGYAEDRDKGKGACARWCDSDFAVGEKLSLTALLAYMDAAWSSVQATASAPRWCVITGGEPLLQVDRPLMVALREAGWHVALETNGTVNPLDAEGFIADLFDHITLSPKLGTEEALLLRRCTDLKVVLPGDVGGGGWTDEALLRLAKRITHIYAYVQPQDPVEPTTVSKTFLTWKEQSPFNAPSRYTENLKRCIDFVMAHPEWALSLQTHKYIEVP